jgi:hypothetical protein
MTTCECSRCPTPQTHPDDVVESAPARDVLSARQYLAESASSASPERLFRSAGLVKRDLWGHLLDTTAP